MIITVTACFKLPDEQNEAYEYEQAHPNAAEIYQENMITYVSVSTKDPGQEVQEYFLYPGVF